MSFWYQLNSRVVGPFFFSLIIAICFPGSTAAAVVTLDSITIYTTHEWLGVKPTVYFQCKGENKTKLPDVKEVNVSYTFKGEESWQPLTNLTSKKCKRCGFYEEDLIKADDVFDEWEFCLSEFTDSDGKYKRVKEKEFVATFSCPQCVPLTEDTDSTSGSHNGEKRMHIALVIIIVALVATLLTIGVVVVIKYWQKRKREQDQARFLKLFEDGDDIEDELGLGTVL